MARPEIVVPGAAHTVAADAKSLWIVPDLWKTHRTRFPQGPWTRTERAPTRSTGPIVFQMMKEKDKDNGGIDLRPRRHCSILSALA